MTALLERLAAEGCYFDFAVKKFQSGTPPQDRFSAVLLFWSWEQRPPLSFPAYYIDQTRRFYHEGGSVQEAVDGVLSRS